MTKLKRTFTLFMALVCLSLIAVGCNNSPSNSGSSQSVSSQDQQPASDHKELTVYTAQPEEELATYFDAFRAATGIKVNYIRLSAGEILARLQAESANPQASVFFGASTDNFIAAKNQGLLEAYSTPNLKDLPAEYLDKDGYFTPYYLNAFGFAVNTDWFAERNLPYPQSWEDLLKPEFKDQITMAHPSTSGTGYTVLATIVQLMGEEKGFEYVVKFNQNVRQYTKLGAAPVNDVGLGEASIALVFAQDALRSAKEGYPIAVTFPSDGVGYEVGAMAIVKGGPAKEAENAKLFIDYFSSKEGQELFEKAGAYKTPLNKNAAPPQGAVQISELKTIAYDSVWAGENRKRLVEKFTAEVRNADNLKQ